MRKNSIKQLFEGIGVVIQRVGGVLVIGRLLVLCLSALSSVYIARSLGASKLGFSTLANAVLAQIMVLVTVLPDSLLMRKYSEVANREVRERLIEHSAGFRLVVSAGVGCVAVGIYYAIARPGFIVAVAIAFAFAGLIAKAITPSWLLQVELKTSLQTAIEVSSSLLLLILYLVLVTNESSRGVDLLCQGVVALVGLMLTLLALKRLGRSRLFPVRLTGGMLSEIAGILWNNKSLVVIQVCTYLYTNLETTILGIFIGKHSAAIYRTAQTWTQIANLVLVIPPVFLFPRYLSLAKVSVAELHKYQSRCLVVGFAFSVFSGSIALLCIPKLHVVWFGPEYAGAGLPAAILYVSKMIVLLTSILSWGLLADKTNDYVLALLTVGTAGLSILLNLLVVNKLQVEGVALVNIISETFMFIAVFLFWKGKVKHYENCDSCSR